MNSSTLAPSGATATPPAAKLIELPLAAPESPSAAKRVEQLHTAIVTTAESALLMFGPIEEAEGCKDGEWLASDAESHLREWLNMVKQTTLHKEAAEACRWALATMVMATMRGAIAVENSNNARRPVLQATLALLETVDDMLASPVLAAVTTGPDFYQEQWMRGKAKFADMLRAIEANKEACELEARFRPRGARQRVQDVEIALSELRFDALAEGGFSAALAGYLSCVMSGATPIDIEQSYRALTYEDWIGGPNTVYVDEEQATATNQADPDEEPVSEEEGFRLGAAMFVNMVRKLHKDVDAATADAGLRELGVEQNTGPVRLALEAVETYPWVKDGFIVAMTAYLGALGPGGPGILDEGKLAKLRREDCGVGTGAKLLEGASAAPTEAAAWRLTLANLLDDLCDLLNDARTLDISIGNNAHASALLWTALQTMDKHEGLRLGGTADDYYGECFTFVEAMLIGARDMSGISASMTEVLHAACTKAARISKLLDGADGEEAARDAGGGHPPLDDSSGSMESPEPDRVEVARRAATFIARLVAHFQQPGRQGTMGDLGAIGQSASVIISALSDPVEGSSSLAQRLERALEESSVVFEAQPPAYWKSPGRVRLQDVGKHLSAGRA